jgi:hypothetical protein
MILLSHDSLYYGRVSDSSPPEYQAGFMLPLKQHSCGRKYNTHTHTHTHKHAHTHAYLYHEEALDYLFEFKGP